MNRARGTKLVAPDEVYQAAKNIELKYPQGGVVYYCYPSGIKVLKDATLSDESISGNFELSVLTNLSLSKTIFQKFFVKLKSDKIVELMFEHECLSPQSYALCTNLTPIVAREQLLMTESMGKICRDESDRGTYFYINKLLCC